MWKYLCLFLGLFPSVTQAQETDSLFFQESSQSGTSMIQHYRKPAEPFMKTRLHLVSDFLKKFNDTTLTEEYPTAETARAIRLGELFSPTSLSIRADLKNSFIEAMGLKLQEQPQENLYAEVLVLVQTKGQQRTHKLYLKKQKMNTNWSWQLVGSGSITGLENQPGGVVDSTQFIPPNAHELNFMSLPQLLQKDLRPFVAQQAAGIPELQSLVSSVYIGELKLLQSLATTLYLDTRLGWYLKLRQFSQESEYSGWLIEDLLNQPEALPEPLRNVLQLDTK